MRRAVAKVVSSGGFLCATFLTPSSADAVPRTPSQLELGWSVAPGCPDRAWAARSVGLFLLPGAEKSRDVVQVDVTITSIGDRFRAQIVTRGARGTGERVFDGATCESVARAATLVVAITLDPTGVAERVRVESEAPVPETQVGFGAAASGDWGSLPKPTLGVGGTVEVRHERLHVGATATAWLPRVELKGPRPGTGGEIGLYAAMIRGCFDFDDATMRLGVCAGAELGVTTGRGIEIRAPETSSGLWGTGFVGLSIHQVTAAPLRPALFLDIGAPFVRPTYTIDDFGPVFQASPVIARAELAVAWFFP